MASALQARDGGVCPVVRRQQAVLLGLRLRGETQQEEQHEQTAGLDHGAEEGRRLLKRHDVISGRCHIEKVMGQQASVLLPIQLTDDG